MTKLSEETMRKESLPRSRSTNSMVNPSDEKAMRRTHSFASYTKRNFLGEKKVRGAPEVSGIDWYKINPEKFKSNWKTIEQPKFDTLPKKHLNRYDRDCPHWFTQLSYNPKKQDKSIKSHLVFE